MALDPLQDQAGQQLLDQSGEALTGQPPGVGRPAPTTGTPYQVSFVSFNAEDIRRHRPL